MFFNMTKIIREAGKLFYNICCNNKIKRETQHTKLVIKSPCFNRFVECENVLTPNLAMRNFAIAQHPHIIMSSHPNVLISSTNYIPVNYFPEIGNIGRSLILFVEIVGMFPNITCEDRLYPCAKRISCVTLFYNLQ